MKIRFHISRQSIGLVIMILMSCNSKQTSDHSVTPDQVAIPIDNEFKGLIDSLPVIRTPITFDSDNGIRYEPFAIENTDLLTRLQKRIPTFLGYGKVDDTKDYYLLIGISTSDLGSPVLMTFDKEGNKIDSFFMFETAGGDIGYYSKNIVTLKTTREFIFTDSTLTRELNETGDGEIEGTDSLIVKVNKYRITDTGGIEVIKD